MLPRGHRALPAEQVARNQRARILAAVTEVLAEHGYAHASVRHIIEAAGVSRRSFYELFADKDDAVGAAYEDASKRLSRQLGRAWRAQAFWPEKVRAAIHAALKFAAEDPAVANLLAIEPAAIGRDAMARHHRSVADLAAALRDGREQSSDAAFLPMVSEQALVGAVVAVVAERVSAGRAARLPDLTPGLVQLVLIPYLGAVEARKVAR